MKKACEYDVNALPRVICEAHPEWVTAYDATWKVAFQNIEYPPKAGWKPQLVCAPGSGNIWQWDSCFMTLFSRFSNGCLPGMNNLDNIYRLQRQDGYISMTYRTESEQEAYGERVNPPLFAWAEWEYYLVTGDDTRLPDVFPRLCRYYDWLRTNRTRSSGLYWFEDSGSTGMDNSPRSGYAAVHQQGSDVCFVDFACQQALSALCLEKIARHIGNKAEAAKFAAEHKALQELINDFHWCEGHQFYYDVFARGDAMARHNFLAAKTVAGFWPMLAEVADARQVAGLVAHLENPDEFQTMHPVPSLSRDDPNYDPLGGYWLGGVWAPTNYMIVKGLVRQGLFASAREIAKRHLSAITAILTSKDFPGIWEAYAPEHIRPATNKSGKDTRLVRNNFVGWTGLGPISTLIEILFGLSFDAEQNRITWRIDLSGRHGIENLRFNRKTVNLMCQKTPTAGVPGQISVVTDGDLILEIITDGQIAGTMHSLPAGNHEIKF